MNPTILESHKSWTSEKWSPWPCVWLVESTWIFWPCAGPNTRSAVRKCQIDPKFLIPSRMIPYDNNLKGFYNRFGELRAILCTSVWNKPRWSHLACVRGLIQLHTQALPNFLKILITSRMIPYDNILKGFYNRFSEFCTILCTSVSHHNDSFEGSELDSERWLSSISESAPPPTMYEQLLGVE